MKKSIAESRKAHPPSRKELYDFEKQPSRVISRAVKGIIKDSNIQQLAEALTNGRKS